LIRRKDIIICGERYPLENSPADVISFADDRRYDFRAKGRELKLRDPSLTDNWAPRRKSGDNESISTLEDLRGAIRTVVLHSDLVSSASACFDTLLGRRPNPLSTHFMINWDGTIIQGLDVMYTAFHAGGHNSDTIGIDLNNQMPNILRPEEAARYPGYDLSKVKHGKEFRRYRSGVMHINGARVQSYGYTDAQYQALIELLKLLTQELGIPSRIPVGEGGAVIPGVLETPSFEGIVAHWHFSPLRWDPGPGFDWERVLYGLSGEFNSFPLLLAGEKNISEIYDPGEIRKAAERLYGNNEQAGLGGTYPVGRHQNWHGGTHFFAPEGTAVRAMFDGKVVLAHNSDRSTLLGSNNFVLMRHDIPFPTIEDAPPKILKFYSLYMHLHRTPTEGPEVPGWVRLLLTGEDEKSGTPQKDLDKSGEDADEMVAEEGERGDVFLRLGYGSRVFEQGGLAWFSTDNERALRVRSGQVIGYVGDFGRDEERENLVHVEIFTDDTWRHAVDMSIHRRHFTLFTEDVARSLIVRSSDVLSILSGGRSERASTSGLRGTMSPDDIEAFFTEPENDNGRQLFRKAVTRHVSEWSDKVDWIQALLEIPEEGETSVNREETARRISALFRGRSAAINANSAFAEVLRGVLPFVWLTEDVASRIGLVQQPWKGVLFHFHPVHFLIWLTFHANRAGRVVAKGVSKTELRRRVLEESKKFQEQSGGWASPDQSEFFTDISLIRPEDLDDVGGLEGTLEELKDLPVPFAWPVDE